MDKWEYQNKLCYLENRVVRESCKQRTACIFKNTFISYDSVRIEAIFHLKECSFRNDFTPIVCLFRARASVPQATICSLASPSAMQKNRSLNATIQLLVGTATEITHATRRNLSAEQGCRKRYCPACPEAYLFEYFDNWICCILIR